MRTIWGLILTISATSNVSVYPQAVKIENTNPTVFLSVERRDETRVWFRLNNNTKWAISVLTGTFYFKRQRTADLESAGTVFTLPSDTEIDSLHYYVEKEPNTPSRLKAPEIGYPDSSSVSWISSKGSILFSVPMKRLGPGLMIYVSFHYEWELNRQLVFNNEPEHRVYFRGVDLSAR